MSMKRSRQPSRGRSSRDDESDFSFGGPKTAEPDKEWAQWMEGKADDAFVPYAITGHFQQGALIAHQTFGRGAVVAVDGRRIVVLFEAGKKTLTHAG